MNWTQPSLFDTMELTTTKETPWQILGNILNTEKKI